MYHNKQSLNETQIRFLRKCNEYEHVYRERLRAYQSLDVPDQTSWDTLPTEQEYKSEIGSAWDYLQKYSASRGAIGFSRNCLVTKVKLKNDANETALNKLFGLLRNMLSHD